MPAAVAVVGAEEAAVAVAVAVAVAAGAAAALAAAAAALAAAVAVLAVVAAALAATAGREGQVVLAVLVDRATVGQAAVVPVPGRVRDRVRDPVDKARAAVPVASATYHPSRAT